MDCASSSATSPIAKTIEQYLCIGLWPKLLYCVLWFIEELKHRSSLSSLGRNVYTDSNMVAINQSLPEVDINDGVTTLSLKGNNIGVR